MTDNSMPPLSFSAEKLDSLTRAIFEAAGSSRREAGLIADQLVEANLRGHDSHGVGMIPFYVRNILAGELKLNQELSIVLDSGSLIVCESGLGAGQVMAHDAMEKAITRAVESGSCLLALRNSHHIGRIGHWAEQCAAAGLVSVHFVNVVAEPNVAPFGGAVARFGTNPFAVGVPRRDRDPVILDFATSKWAAGKVRVALNSGKKVPPGTVLDASGQPTDDPAALFGVPKGTLLPFGEHKGWGLALACELLGGALSGGPVQAGPKTRSAIINSMFSIVVSPERLGTLASFNEQTEAFIEWVLSDADGPTSVLIAGDPERRTKDLRMREGIPIDPVTWGEIVTAGEQVGLSQKDPPGLD
jgi:uncharacterized oxidoreductase